MPFVSSTPTNLTVAFQNPSALGRRGYWKEWKTRARILEGNWEFEKFWKPKRKRKLEKVECKTPMFPGIAGQECGKIMTEEERKRDSSKEWQLARCWMAGGLQMLHIELAVACHFFLLSSISFYFFCFFKWIFFFLFTKLLFLISTVSSILLFC